MQRFPNCIVSVMCASCLSDQVPPVVQVCILGVITAVAAFVRGDAEVILGTSRQEVYLEK